MKSSTACEVIKHTLVGTTDSTNRLAWTVTVTAL